MKWILIQVINREISTFKFDYLQDAVSKMKEMFYEYNKESTDCYIGDLYAWITDIAECNWKIIEV